MAGATLRYHDGKRSRPPGGSRPGDRAADRAVAAPAVRRAEPRDTVRDVDRVQSAAMLVRSRQRSGRLLRPLVLRVFRRGRLLQAAARGRVGRVYVPEARAVGLDVPAEGGRPAAHRRAVAQSRPLHAQAPHPRRRPSRAVGDGAYVRDARGGRGGAAGHDPRRYARHSRATLCPGHAKGSPSGPPSTTAADGGCDPGAGRAAAPGQRRGCPPRAREDLVRAPGTVAIEPARSARGGPFPT